MDRITAARVFVETVERGSVSRAAEHLDMSRAMASRYVSSLEDWANARLLHRTTRRLSLTEAGKLMLPLCEQMLAVERAVGEVAIPDDVPRGTLRVAAPTIFSEMYLVGAIAEFLVLNPQVSIDLQTSDRTVDLVEERIDIALRISQQLEPNLISRRLGACPSVLCASPDYLERRGVPSSLADIKHHDCLTYAFFGDGEWRLDDGSGFQPIKINGRFRTDETLEIRRAALEGLGITILPEFCRSGRHRKWTSTDCARELPRGDDVYPRDLYFTAASAFGDASPHRFSGRTPETLDEQIGPEPASPLPSIALSSWWTLDEIDSGRKLASQTRPLRTRRHPRRF